MVDAPLLPSFDVPVPLMVEQLLLGALSPFDSHVPELVIEVPKILTPSRCPRTVLSVPLTAEQLVEVPTIVSLLGVTRPVEQACGVGREEVEVFTFYTQDRTTAFGEADHRVAAATAQQIVDVTVPRGAPHDVHPVPLRAAGSTGLPGTANQGFFRTLPQIKKVSVSSWTRAAYEAADEARREARRQETLRLAADALDHADKLTKRRKKRKKKKLPRGRFSRGLACRRHRQWVAPSWFFGRPELPGIMVGMDVKDSLCYAGYATPRVTFPSVFVRPRMLCIMAGMDQKVSVFYGSGICMAGIAGNVLRVVFPTVDVRPRCSASGSVWTRRTGMLIEGVAALVFECGSGLLWAGFAGYDASHAEFPLVVGRTRMLGILVSMDQKDRYAFSGCSHAHCVQRQVPWLWGAENCGISAVAVFQVVDTPFVTQRCIPMVLVTMEIPQLRLDMVGRWPFVAGRAVPCCDAEADPHGPDCLSDHRDSPVASHGVQCPVVQGVLVVDIPVVVQRPIPMVLPVWKTIETPLCSTFPGGRCP